MRPALRRLIIIAIAVFVIPMAASAGGVQTACTDPLKPCLSVPIPNLKFSDITKIERDGQVINNVPYLVDYINAVYRYALGISVVVAATMFMIGGFRYLTAGGDAGKVSQGKENITNAVIGLVLAFTAYVILNTVNPELTSLRNIEVITAKRIEFELPQDFAEDDAGGAGQEGVLPMATTSSDNFKEPITFNSANLAALTKAAADLAEKTKDAPYGQQKIAGGGARSLDTQARLFRERCIAGTFSGSGSSMTFTLVPNAAPGAKGRVSCTIPTCNPYKPGDFIVTPDAQHQGKWLRDGATKYADFCPHTSGKAVDISCSKSQGAIHGIFVPCHKILEEVMKENGFCRLKSEPWHFELPNRSGSGCPTSWSIGSHTEKGVSHTYGNCEEYYDSYSEKRGEDDSSRCYSSDK